MLYFSKIRIFLISLFTLIFVIFALSNFTNIGKKIFDKKINLGLDLQGGSYLLLEIDNQPIIEQKLQNTLENNFFELKTRSLFSDIGFLFALKK